MYRLADIQKIIFSSGTHMVKVHGLWSLVFLELDIWMKGPLGFFKHRISYLYTWNMKLRSHYLNLLAPVYVEVFL